MSQYSQLISDIDPDAEPRWVEAWMRLEYGTLDHLSRPTFEREVKIAINCIEESSEDENEGLAVSYGL